MTFTTRIALVDTTGTVPPTVLAEVAGAVMKQIEHDVAPIWNVHANIVACHDPAVAPAGSWRVELVAALPGDHAAFHLTEHNQPAAKVVVSDPDTWTLAASHEIIEMLIDPWGNRLQPSLSRVIQDGRVKDGLDEVDYLVEVCDPCESAACSYRIDGVRVSDFITPDWYGPPFAGGRFSFSRKLLGAREVFAGGYASWIDRRDGQVHQLVFRSPGGAPKLRSIGKASGASLRAYVDART